MSSKRILFIGRTSFDNTPCAGEVVKNQLLFERISSVTSNKVDKIDTMHYLRRYTLPLLFLKLLFRICFFNYNMFIISTHDVAAKRIINFLGRFHKAKDVYYWVIGGGVSKKIENGELNSIYYKDLAYIIVEDCDMENHFRKMGFENVLTLPNFKPVFKINAEQSCRSNKFVFVSRITPLKGCDIIISAVKQLNRKGLLFSVDFYGFIEDGYPFEEYIQGLPNVEYKGTLSLKTQSDYEYLSHYTALLFPSFYPNEGFPGTMIDGFIAGLPIVSTDWRYNSHIVNRSKTGWLIPPQDSYALAVVMEDIISGKYNLSEMHKKCLEEACKYDINNVLSKQTLITLTIL